MSRKILIAGVDSSDTRRLKLPLEQQDWKVITAFTGAEALAAREKERPDAVILDVALPDVSGHEILGYMKRTSLSRKTAVILIYPLNAADEDFFHGCLLGADVKLRSPADPRDVIAFLSRMFRSTEETA